MPLGAARAMRPLLLLCLTSFSLSFAAFSSSSASSSATLQFTNDGYNASIQENSRPRTYVGSRRLMGVSLDALPPSAQIRFSIVEGDLDGFFTSETEEIGGVAVLQIRTRTGLNDVLNRERKSEYFLTVVGEVRNHHKLYTSSVTTLVKVEVSDINDNIPLFYEDTYDVTIGEDANLHTPLVTVSAEDADIGTNGKVYYSLADISMDLFSVHPTSGVVSLTGALDRSVKRQHKLVVICEDRGVKPRNHRKSAASQAVIYVNVVEVNLHSPKLNINNLPHVVEHAHTHIYAIITVQDEDVGKNGDIKSVNIINGDPNRLFNIVKGSKPNEYNLAVLKLLDRELAPSGYNLTLRAIDGGIPSRSSIANINVNIADINDQAPIFVKEQYEEAVSEEAPPHTAVVRVAATDIDQGNNGQVLFRILAGNEDEKFKINALTGLISTNEWLDAETAAYYSLAVAAIDQASNAQRKQSSAKVIIRVVDGNDNAPQFSTPNTEVTIDENEPTGSYVTRVLAADSDSGENGFVSYSIANLDQVPFTIDPFDGTIRTSSVLDFEAERRVYTIKVRASDWGQPLKRETETTVKVKVRDVNDNRPVFVGSVCSGWIDLDAPVGSTITSFKAVDLDDGDKVFYRLEESDFKECWAIDSSTGVLAVACKLRERNSESKKNTVVINVTATDGRHISDKATLSLAVIDKEKEVVKLNQNNARVACQDTTILAKQMENEALARENNEAVETFALFPPRYGYNSHSPEFPPKFPEFVDILEDAEIGDEVLKVDATDHDRGHNGRIVYSIAHGDVDSVFKIGTETGIITVWAPLDRERTSKYILNISVYDLGVPHKFSSKNVTVNILDVNDNSPEFTQLSYSLHLPENTRNGTSVAQIVAKDADLGQNGLVTYELVTKLHDFSLDSKSGILYVTSLLDREIRDEYDLRIRAWDNALENPRFSLARVLVTVLDINDCAPDFGAGKRLKLSIPEDIPVGAVVATLQASDKDLGAGGQITYSFLSGSGKMFRVDSATGIVRVSSKLDYETRQQYNITVMAADGGHPPLSSTANLLVQVTNVDENSGPPQISKRVIRASVLENQPPGTLVTAIDATDPDGGELSFDIVGGTGQGVFSVTKKGEIRTLRRLDREVTKGYWLTVTVSDGATVPLTDTCHIYVEVEDMNDHIPQTENPVYLPTVKEDAPVGTTVVILKASDGDLSPSNISYFISRSRKRRNGWMLNDPEGEEDAQEIFAVDKLTGVVSTTALLDRERQSEYDLWIGITDGQLTSLTPVFISVTDVNDNPPEFLEKVYRFNVPSRTRPQKRQPIFRVFARDIDVGRNANIRYSIKTRKGKSRFKVNESTGHILCSKTLSPGQTYDLTVKATDNGFPQLSSSAHVIIRIVEIPSTSDHKPIVDKPATAHVMEMDPPGHVVAFINAFDLDNDTLWYSLEDGDDENVFSIGLDSGVVSLAKQLDRESQDTYRLTIAVTDGVHTTSEELNVKVMDFNDHRPTFSQTEYKTQVSEGSKVGSTVLTFRCHDRDDLSVTNTSPSSLFFVLHHTESVESQSLFSLDPTSGKLVLAQPLNRELLAAHTLTVSCQDRSGIQREDLVRVTIVVEDSNDHDPLFLEPMVEAQVSEGAVEGTVVARVTAVDEDEGENGRVSYSIVEGNQGATFSIDPELGNVILAQPLNKEGVTEYLLLVRAMDHATKPKSSSVPVRITIKSSPDIPPTWRGTKLPRVVELSEWTSINTIVAMVTASSPPSLLYEIISGNSDEETFVVSPSSGVLSLKLPLDYEATNFYNLTIKATNAVGIYRSTWVSVRVLDENDWAPEWEELEYEGSVTETSPVGSPVISSIFGRFLQPLTVTATDKDDTKNGLVTYSIVEKNALNIFSVDEFTGAVRVAGRLNEVAGRIVEMSVWARDSGDPRRECVVPAYVRVFVRKVSKPYLVFAKELCSTSLYLPTVIGVKVFCASVSQQIFKEAPSNSLDSSPNVPRKPIRYSITSGDEHKHFKMDPVDGCVYVSNHVELQPLYNLTLNASDDRSISASTLAVINVQELPKGALKFTQEKFWANVLENTTNEMNLLVVGIKGLPLNSHVKYSLLNANEFFEIRPTSGILKTTGKPFDWEKQDHFALIVEAREVGHPDSFGHATVHVAVLDVNDNEPVFVGQPYDALVSTSAQRGHVIAKVRAVDADSGAFGEVRYELVRGSGELFSVGKRSGAITLKQPLTTADKSLSLTVAAYDGGKQPLSSQAHVIIRIVSAEGPLFDRAFYRVTVPENKPIGSAVTRVEARSPSGNDIIYTIISGDLDGLFDLDYRTGVIRIASLLDFEVSANHSLTIRGWDPLTGLHSDSHVIIQVTDVNDNSPEFQKILFTGEVTEAAHIGYTVLKVQAYDKDTGSGGIIRYECSSGCGNFSVDPESGYVLLAGSLDAETQTKHTLTITARDLGLPPLSASATVVINVLDFNDNPPLWAQDIYHSRVSTEAKAGHVITALSAKDADITNSDGSQLVYHIISGDSQSLFYLNPNSGLLSVTAPQKLVGGSTISLNISASDSVHVAFSSLRIAVLSANDNSPKFLKPFYENSVEENVPPGLFVLSVEATDEDGGPFGQLRYEILGQEKDKKFTIDEEGQIYTETSLDRESESLYDIVVSVQDGGGKADFAKVQIYVADKNDNYPIFTLPQYQANIPVDTPPDTSILKVHARDADEGANSKVRYALYEDDNAETLRLFRIDAEAGELFLTEEVNDRENEVFQFFIRATDEGMPSLHSDVPVTIFLINAHERAPFCPKKYAQFFLPEDAALGSVVTSLWQDGPMEVHYTILSNEKGLEESEENKGSSTPFSLSPSGDVIVKGHLDHEKQRVHSITVVNETMSTPPLVDYMTISIVVMDVNDCTPEFSTSSYDITVAENSPVGVVITKLLATDKDEGSNGQVQYSFKNTTDKWIKSVVSIDPHSGSVTLISTLDRESNDSFSFIVLATDSGANPLSVEAIINVFVEDYNDNPPFFSKDIYVTSVPEGSAIGTVIVELALHDDDFQTSPLDFFVLGSEDGGRFLVHGSGQVYVSRPLDREIRDHYSLTVTATDGKFSANTTVSITVIDINDNGPECKELLYRRVVPEDVSVGSHVVSISVYDADEGPNAKSRFFLTGEGFKDFSVDQQTGKIVTARRLDRESQNFYDLTVIVEDWTESAWRCETSLQISVSDVNDNPPKFLQETFSLFISEDAPVNGVLTKVQTTDSDLGKNRRVRYSLIDSAGGHFSVDPSEGIISLVKPLDRELKDTFTVVVEAKDTGTPSYSSSAILTITVTDVNDNPPEFVRTLQQVTIAENSPIGTEISRVMATSKDIGINAEITYSLEHTTEEEFLRIHPKTGVISINSFLDYEAVQLVVATVIAIDGGTPPLSATALLNVTVADINDNSPVFSQVIYEASIAEDQRPGRSILQVSANDADFERNGEIAYSITEGNKEERFAIESDSGIISLKNPLDREKVSEYELEITGTDKGSPSNSEKTSVKIVVLDVNDNPPRFLETNYTAIVQENRPVGYKVVGFMVTDDDIDPNGHPFTWELLGNSPLTGSSASRPFSLDQDGTLKLATNKLDHRVKDLYEVSVRVWDSGSPPMSADTTVKITIVEESRYPPTLFPLYTNIVSYMQPFSGGIIGKITALDQDPYDVLHYSIDLNKESDYFDVDEQDGTIVALSPLDSGVYSVNLSVSDGKYERSVTATVEVFLLDDDMVDNAVIIRIGPLSSEEFLARYKKIFLTTVGREIDVGKDNVQLLSIQPTFSYSSNNIKTNKSRTARDLHESVDILLVAMSEVKGIYISRQKLIELLREKMSKIQLVLPFSLFSVMDSMCNEKVNCSNHGSCIDIVEISEETPTPLNTQSYSLVTPRFKQKTGCSCDQGYDGLACEHLINACGYRPCFEYEECLPSTTLSRGYSCHCPNGKAGPRCHINISECQKPSCHYPIRPLSFKGKSYAQYSMHRPLESSSLQLSSYIRTRDPAGIIFYAAGEVDYSILEISGGYVQYRWDCGSGEGLVRVPNARVDDDKWHFINLTRDGTVSELSVDGKLSSGAAPGVHDILNIESGSLYVGAKVKSVSGPVGATSSFIEFGFVGCVDLINMNGFSLPVSVNSPTSIGKVNLKRLANVELQCPEVLPPPGVCGSHPCLNGGTCKELNSTYSCFCSSRFTGAQCQIDTAPCSSSPCLNGGTCSVVGHNYKCKCPLKLSGKRCEYGVYCNPNPCQNGGRCEEGINGPICKCQHFTGVVCEMDIDECTRSPCRNGGTCLNLYGGFRCLCSVNVTGEYCTEPLLKHNPRSNFFLSLKELVCILGILLACIFVILVIVAWQRKRWKHKRHQQNNRVKLTGHHVKNDLKANDIPKRNSKICNVEADQLQQGPLLPRPSSFTPSGTADSVFLHTLKQLADLSVSEHEALELNTMTRRRSNEYVYNLTKPSAVVAPTMASSPSAADSRMKRKPWDHHNNLNETYFTPSKDIGFDLPPNLEEHPRGASPGLNSSFSDNSSVPSHQKQRVYQWDDYDLRGSASMLTFGSPAGVGGLKDSFKNPSPRVSQSSEGDCPEGEPLIEGSSFDPTSIATRQCASPSTPLLISKGNSYNNEGTGDEDEANDDYDDKSEPCSFDEVLYENNISSTGSNECISECGSVKDLSIQHSSENGPFSEIIFNIVSDIEDEEEKISNIPAVSKIDLPSPTDSFSVPDSVNRMGSPRSRKPFVRSDFGRVSDVSFLSTLEEEDGSDFGRHDSRERSNFNTNEERRKSSSESYL